MASPGPKPRPHHLRLLTSRTDSSDVAGRPIHPQLQTKRGLPTKPDSLSPDASWMWDQIIDQWQSSNLLKPLDAAGLEVACETFARWREAVRWRKEHALLVGGGREGARVAPYIGVEERAGKDFRAWCAEFGLTPSAETRLNTPNESGSNIENPFD